MVHVLYIMKSHADCMCTIPSKKKKMRRPLFLSFLTLPSVLNISVYYFHLYHNTFRIILLSIIPILYREFVSAKLNTGFVPFIIKHMGIKAITIVNGRLLEIPRLMLASNVLSRRHYPLGHFNFLSSFLLYNNKISP